MLPFCEAGDGESIIWRHNGFSRCLSTVAGSIVTSGIVIIVGISLVVLKCRPQNNRRTASSSKWTPLMKSIPLFIEVVLSLLMSITFIFEAVIHGVLPGAAIYGYFVVSCPTSAVAWLFCVYMVLRERYNVLYGLNHSIPIVAFWLASLLWFCFAITSWQNPEWWWKFSHPGHIDVIDLVVFSIRTSSVLLLLLVGVIRPFCTRSTQYRLLVNMDDESPGRNVEPIASQNEEDLVKAGSFSRNSSKGSTFGNIYKKTKQIFPFVWPKGQLFLQIQIVICLVILAAGRVINLYVPLYYKIIIDALTPNSNLTSQFDLSYGLTDTSTGVTFPVASVFIYVFLRFLQGGSVGSSGFSNNLRAFLWINVQQYTSRTIQVKLFDHLHGLSLRWHLGRKTGEILRVIDRGMTSVNNLLSYILFNILPTFVDIGIAVVYFVIAFDAWFGLIVFTTMVCYLLFTVYITEWRTKFRRMTNERDNKSRAISVDSLLNFETVKYYGQEEFEVNRFNDAVVYFQKAEWQSLASLNVLGLGQNFIISLGLLGGAMLCAYRLVLLQNVGICSTYSKLIFTYMHVHVVKRNACIICIYTCTHACTCSPLLVSYIIITIIIIMDKLSISV